MTNEEIKVEFDLIIELWKKSHFQEALSRALLLCQSVENSEEKFFLSNIYNAISNIYADLSNYENAIEFCNKSISLNIVHKNETGLASNYSNLGIIYVKLGNYQVSLEYFSQALTLNEQVENSKGIASVLGNIGGLYIQLKEFSKALEYFEKALEVNQRINERDGIASNLGNIANVFSFLSQHEKALEYNEKALQINYELQNKRRIALNLGNIGNCFIKFNNFEKGLEYFEKANEIYTELGSKEGIAINLYNTAYVLIELSEFVRAEETLNSVYSICKEINHKSQISKCYELYSHLYAKLERFEDAYRYHKKFTELKDEILSEESTKKAQQFDQRRKIEEDEKARQLKLARFQEQEKILHNILPVNIADRILNQETFIADHFQSVSVLFMDLVGFTPLSSIAPPKQLVFLLDAIFQKADEIVESFGLEKIKTIGDGYLAVANVTTPLENHQKATALAALQLLETMNKFSVNIPEELGDTNWTKDMKDIEIRIGIHTGEIVAGIIGKNKYTYDLWGDAVNVASRMESNSEAGRIHVSDEFAKSISQHPEFSLIPRGEITVKGKGTMNTYWLEKAK